MEYEILIKRRDPYNVKNYKYECEDGKRYSSEYAVPKGSEYKRVEYETGETSFREEEVYKQKVDILALNDVIKSINRMT